MPPSPSHAFEHELAYAAANDLLGSIDINRGDAAERLGHRPVPQQRRRTWRLALYVILKRAGGFSTTAA